MDHRLPTCVSFWLFLLLVDKKLAEKTRQRGGAGAVVGCTLRITGASREAVRISCPWNAATD